MPGRRARHIPAGLPTTVFGIVLCVAGLFAPAAGSRAGEPVAIVEDIAAKGAGLGMMDYVEEGRVIELDQGGTITLGYLASCWLETIRGGSVIVGRERSQVVNGELRRERVDCDGGAIELSEAEAKESGVMVFRKAVTRDDDALPRPRLILFGTSPVIRLTQATGTVIIERLDKPGDRHVVAVKGRFADLAGSGPALVPGGLYQATAGDATLVFKIDPFAEAGRGPVIGRLLQL